MAFRRRINRKASAPLPPGCRPSPSNGSPVVACGVPSLDGLLGGGVHIGSTLVVEEDEFGSYSRILMNLFAAEGAACKHSLFVASASEDPAEVLEHLPGVVGDCQTRGATSDSNGGNATMGIIQEEDDEEASEDLKIAWRYEQSASKQNVPQNQFSHIFDLSQSFKLPAGVPWQTYDALSCSSDSVYKGLLHSLDEFAGRQSLHVGSQNVLRLCLHSIGSPLWSRQSHADKARDGKELLQFLHALQVRLRNLSAVTLITVPSHLWKSTHVMRRVRQLSDYVVHVESFAGSKKQNPLYRDYHGLFHIKKLPCWQSLAPIPLDSTDWAFKLKRKHFSIVKLHLPPDLSDTASRTQEDPVAPRKPVVGSSTVASSGQKGTPSLEF